MKEKKIKDLAHVDPGIDIQSIQGHRKFSFDVVKMFRNAVSFVKRICQGHVPVKPLGRMSAAKKKEYILKQARESWLQYNRILKAPKKDKCDS